MASGTWAWLRVGIAVAALITGSAPPTLAATRGERACIDTWRCTPAPPLHIQLVAAYECDGWLLAVLNLETLNGTEWQIKEDDGQQEIQLHFIGNGAPEGGQWGAIPTVSGGEAWLRYKEGGTIPTYDTLMRVARTDGSGLTSSPKPITPGCPPP